MMYYSKKNFTSVFLFFFLFSLILTNLILILANREVMRGSRNTAKLPMEFLVNTLFPFMKKNALLRIAVP